VAEVFDDPYALILKVELAVAERLKFPQCFLELRWRASEVGTGVANRQMVQADEVRVRGSGQVESDKGGEVVAAQILPEPAGPDSR
jgi:hypothetical protein